MSEEINFVSVNMMTIDGTNVLQTEASVKSNGDLKQKDKKLINTEETKIKDAETNSRECESCLNMQVDSDSKHKSENVREILCMILI